MPSLIAPIIFIILSSVIVYRVSRSVFGFESSSKAIFFSSLIMISVIFPFIFFFYEESTNLFGDEFILQNTEIVFLILVLFFWITTYLIASKGFKLVDKKRVLRGAILISLILPALIFISFPVCIILAMVISGGI